MKTPLLNRRERETLTYFKHHKRRPFCVERMESVLAIAHFKRDVGRVFVQYRRRLLIAYFVGAIIVITLHLINII